MHTCSPSVLSCPASLSIFADTLCILLHLHHHLLLRPTDRVRASCRSLARRARARATGLGSLPFNVRCVYLQSTFVSLRTLDIRQTLRDGRRARIRTARGLSPSHIAHTHTHLLPPSLPPPSPDDDIPPRYQAPVRVRIRLGFWDCVQTCHSYCTVRIPQGVVILETPMGHGP
ncbi:hypothetical protein L227DRAFT_432035 [Lentinus tigrinus ALCF2SS1-6]|uniref:Uncharacterized protein n=1 Tax=Lentinus tigrinus ALCF2SS1-6 TaxID=1328759 RepID=A0A5C2SHQ0_9APHY|nr:hypothetical protein L227DRAFT_432035 [Lentinus tigrinus ALCF2SS1-6]